MGSKGRRKPGERRPPQRRTSLAWTYLLPAAVLAVLCLPCLSLGYFWDDYYFLTLRGRGDFLAYLVPDPRAAFYRPISQGLYFLFLRLVDPSDGTIGHILNLAVLAGTAALLMLLISKLCGRRAGLLSAFVFASFGVTPSLVAWISCSQDLLATALVLLAFLWRLEGRVGAALACATAAVLCKETAIAAFPVLVLWDRLMGRPPVRERLQIVACASVTIVWALIHPGIRLLLGSGFRSGAAGYLGVEHPERWGRYLVRYAMTLVNLPPPGFTASWWDNRLSLALVALVVIAAGFVAADRRVSPHEVRQPVPIARIASIAAIFGVPALLMPAVLIRHWAPYFAFMPAVAAAIYLGPFLARRPAVVALTALALLLVLGARYRGLATEQEPVWSERTFVDAANAVKKVRKNFGVVFPKLPKGSQVVVSVSSTGVRGIHSTLIDGQALRIWYGDPTIRTVPTLKRAPGVSPEYLVRVTTDLDVISIDPDSRRVRSSTPYRPDLAEIGRPLVNYARAVAAAGDTDRAVRIALGLAEAESGPNADYVRRIAAMFLIASGRHEEASRILASMGPLLKQDAFPAVERLLAEASASETLDDAAFEAFGISSSDPEALRWIMQALRMEGLVPQAAWWAERLRRVAPGDVESSVTIRLAERMGVKPRRTLD